jgi:hypothetical protein
MSLTDMYEKIASYDEEIEQQYSELSDTEKTAAEYDAAGRIMARGFADELNKLAQMPPTGPSESLIKKTGKKPWEMPTPKEMPKPRPPAPPKVR